MRFIILVAFGAVALGGYFYEDIDLYFTNQFSGTQGSFSVSDSIGNLGDSVSNNMRNIAGSLGQ